MASAWGRRANGRKATIMYRSYTIFDLYHANGDKVTCYAEAPSVWDQRQQKEIIAAVRRWVAEENGRTGSVFVMRPTCSPRCGCGGIHKSEVERELHFGLE
jgi:hypothetical protein